MKQDGDKNNAYRSKTLLELEFIMHCFSTKIQITLLTERFSGPQDLDLDQTEPV